MGIYLQAHWCHFPRQGWICYTSRNPYHAQDICHRGLYRIWQDLDSWSHIRGPILKNILKKRNFRKKITSIHITYTVFKYIFISQKLMKQIYSNIYDMSCVRSDKGDGECFVFTNLPPPFLVSMRLGGFSKISMSCPDAPMLDILFLSFISIS